MKQNRKDPFELLLRKHLSSEGLSKRGAQCPDENWMAAYLEGTQIKQRNADFEKHLLQCLRCQAELSLLLKSAGMEDESKSSTYPALPTVPSQRRWLDWMRPLTFKPVFALVVVGFVSVFVGYRLIRESKVNAPAEQAAQSLSKEMSLPEPNRNVSSSEGLEIANQKPVDRNSVDSRKGPHSSPSDSERANAAKERPFSERESKQQTDRFDKADATEPFARSKPDEEAREAPSAPPAAPLPASPESDLKDSSSSQDTSRNLRSQSARQARAKRPPERLSGAHPTGSAGAVAQEKINSGARSERDQAAEMTELAPEKRKEGLAASSAIAARDLHSPERIEVAGKLFELRDHVWTDTAIQEDEAVQAEVIPIPSREFQNRRAALTPFEAVLSRPEDVLIKLDHKVYRLRKLRNTRG
jgi:hypothetical protein